MLELPFQVQVICLSRRKCKRRAATLRAQLAHQRQAPAFGERKKTLDVNELPANGHGFLLGLTLDASKGVLSGTPTVAGNYVLQVQASWGYGHLADTWTYVLQVEP